MTNRYLTIDEAVQLTQEKLAMEQEASMSSLLENIRSLLPMRLINDETWEQILGTAQDLPITLASLPFGFEIPLHTSEPVADFGVSLASSTPSAAFIQAHASSNRVAQCVSTLFDEMEGQDASLREIIGRKLMLEFDTGSTNYSDATLPGFFVRPGVEPIWAGKSQHNQIQVVVDALMSCIGDQLRKEEIQNLWRVYDQQKEGTRVDSIGVFPSRSRGIRLAIMGLNDSESIGEYLRQIDWPGSASAVDSIYTRLSEQVNIVETGLNIDVVADGVGPDLGLTLSIQKRYLENPHYWIDGTTDWHGFWEVLRKENLAESTKLDALKEWQTRPTPLFAKAGQLLLMRGIHHLKMVIQGDRITKTKAYLFLVVSGALESTRTPQ